MTPASLARCTGSTLALATEFAPALIAAMARFDINTPRRQAAFLATVGIESAHLGAVEEGLYYRDAARLASIYPRAFKTAQEAQPYTRNAVALGRFLYAGYWGRGLIQLTWLKNYQAASDGLGHDYVAQPGLLREAEHAALTAAWFWHSNGCNAAADASDMRAVTRIVNGSALMHLSERTALYVRGLPGLLQPTAVAS